MMDLPMEALVFCNASLNLVVSTPPLLNLNDGRKGPFRGGCYEHGVNRLSSDAITCRLPTNLLHLASSPLSRYPSSWTTSIAASTVCLRH